MMMWGWGDRAWWVIESVFLRKPVMSCWPGMPRLLENRVLLCNLLLKLIVPRVTIGMVTPFIPRERPNVKYSIAGYLRLPRPTSAPALMQELYWHRCWAEEPGYATGNPPKIMVRYKEAAASLEWLLQTGASLPRLTACNRRNRSLMTKSTTTNNHPGTPSKLIV